MSLSTEPEMLDIDSEYSEELKLNVPCDNDDSHSAVLYCPKCEFNLCSMCLEDIHWSPAFAKHEVVRLTKKPEPTINCHLHPQKEAELVCKEPNCQGVNKPICIICQQYGTHKNHSCEILDNEYNRIRKTITNCLEQIDTKTTTCDENLEEYERCIASYSTTDDDFMRTEREKIDKFYSDARTRALKTFDDFAETQIRMLKYSQKKYESDKTKLENTKAQLQSFEQMCKKDVLENGTNVETLAKQAEINIDEPVGIIPSKCHKIIYPYYSELLSNIKIEIDPTAYQKCFVPKIPLIFEPRNQEEKMLAVYYVDADLNVNGYNSIYYTLESFKEHLKCGGKSFQCFQKLGPKKSNISKTFKFDDDGRTMLYMSGKPDEDTVDLQQHKYISVIHCNVGCEKRGEFYALLGEQIVNKWFSRIVVMVDLHISENQKEFVDKITEIAGSNERIEVWKNKDEEIVDILFKN